MIASRLSFVDRWARPPRGPYPFGLSPRAEGRRYGSCGKSRRSPRTPRAWHGEGSTPTVARRTPDIAEVGFIIERLEASLAIEPLVWQEGRTTAREDDGPSCLELVSKLFPAVIGCEARGSALSAKKVLGVLEYASEPFPPPALPTDFSLDFASEPVWKPVLGSQLARETW